MIRTISLLPLAGAILGAVIALSTIMTQRRRASRTAVFYVLLNASIGLWGLREFLALNLGVGLESSLAPIGSGDYWLEMLILVAIAGAPTYWFLFAAEHARMWRVTHGWGLAITHIYAVYTVVVGGTNSLHGLFIASVEEGSVQAGPLVYPHYAGAWFLLTGGLIILVREAWKRGTAEGRRDAVLILVASAAPLVGGFAVNAMLVAGIPRELSLAPILLPPLVAALGYLVFRTGFADVVPLAASEAFHSMRDAAFVIDTRGVIVAMNEAAQEAFPTAASRYRLAAVSPTLYETIEATNQAGRYAFEFEGARRAWWGRVHPMRPNWGRSVGLLVMLTDITDLKEKEQELFRARGELERRVRQRTRELEIANAGLEEATRAKDRFLANVSHELRTPLSSIIAFADALLAGVAEDLTPEQRERVGVIAASGRHQRAIIDDLLDLSRIKLGRAEVCPRSFSLHEFVKLIADMTRPFAEEEGLEFSVEAPEQDVVLETDQDKVRQILLNLVTNAVKFTEQGSIRLIVELAGPHRVVFRVRDTGPGIDPLDLPNIMDEFVQVERADGMSPSGTGLGLAISQRLATLLGGDLSVTSELGQGSTFSLTIPRSFAPGRVDAGENHRPEGRMA